jgi:hypothetical protein
MQLANFVLGDSAETLQGDGFEGHPVYVSLQSGPVADDPVDSGDETRACVGLD